MKIETFKQRTPEWDAARCGSIGGTRYGQAVSGRDNRLVYDLINERLNGYISESDYIDEAMQFGIDNEPIARQLYSEQTGIEFAEVGMIHSDFSDLHHASPDGLKAGLVLEIKCTENGAIHIQRYFDGPESSYMPQILNYFAISDEVTEVHWVSYCPYREERPIIAHIFTRQTMIKSGRNHVTIDELITAGRDRIKEIEAEVKQKEQLFAF